MKIFHLEQQYYHEKLKIAISKMGGEILNRPDSHRFSGIEVYHIGETNTSLLYDGENVITIGADTEESITKTRSRLEEISEVKLRVIR